MASLFGYSFWIPLRANRANADACFSSRMKDVFAGCALMCSAWIGTNTAQGLRGGDRERRSGYLVLPRREVEASPPPPAPPRQPPQSHLMIISARKGKPT